MIQLEQVSKGFAGKPAVSDINLEVREGQNFVLVGTSGCGKTTTLRMVNRLIEPDAGRILINGQDARKISPPELRRGIGYVLQHHGLFPHYTVAENIAVVPRLLGWKPDRIASRTEELLHKLRLDPGTFLHSYPAQLSGGQQQRVGLARALIADAPIILMDEPFGALDDVTRKSIRQYFMQLEDLRCKTIMLVTHDIGEAFELGDIICIMDRGKIVQQGSKQDVLFRPANEFVENFLSGNRLELQMRITTLRHVVPFLAAFEGDITNAGEIDLRENLWQVLDQLVAGKSRENHFVKTPDSIYLVTANSVMEGFQKFNSHTHGRSATKSA